MSERMTIMVGHHVGWAVSIDVAQLREYLGDPDMTPDQIRSYLAEHSNETDGLGWLIHDAVKDKPSEFCPEEAYVFIDDDEPIPRWGVSEVSL